jgi:flagellar biosynthesis protein FlhB
MSDEDQSTKSEDPTAKRLSEARSKGNVPSSNEIKSWAILMGGAVALYSLFPRLAVDINAMATKFVESPHSFEVSPPGLQNLFAGVGVDLIFAMIPILLLLIILAVLSNLMQVGLLWAPSKIKPEFSKLSPISGAKKLFGPKGWVEFIKGITKILVVGAIAFGLSLPLLSDISLVPTMEIPTVVEKLQAIAIEMTVATVVVMTAIALLDFAWQKYNHTQELKMSPQEVKDEHKQSEGDPLVKSKIRQIRMERAQQRMMAAVPEADVVVTNPTHYAVALQYKMSEMTAPILVAKGMDTLAFRIREVAEENDIPIVENAPVARALYAAVELDEEIPDEHYMAVAEIISYVMRLRGELN